MQPAARPFPWETVALVVIAAGIAGRLIWLAMGLYRARAVDWWMAAMVALGALGITLTGPRTSLAVGIVGAALFLVGMGSIGTYVLRESDADWEHTPDYRGFRPAAGMR